jgi:MYXO-CTERM domain-containing protein
VSALRGALGLALGLATFFGVADAHAFCLTRGCNDAKQDCEYDEHECLLSGHLLHWGSSCISFDVQQDGSTLRGISYDAAHEAIRAGFQEWLNADCGAGVGPGIKISDFGPVECRSAEYNQDAPNANVFMFRDDTWPYENAIDTLALTTLIFNADSGEIYDADVEVNTFESDMSIDATAHGAIHFPSVITHEIGHFLGLSHSDVAFSTMRPSYAPGNTGMATIEQDDIDGVCAALPPNRETASNSCEPRHGFASKCAVPESDCQMAPGAPGGVASAALALLGLSSLLRRRRPRP